jgi:tetratricopeptide (TPR) repeat protein
MGRRQRLFITAILVAICVTADGTRAAHASDEDPVQRVLAAGQQAMLERHYAHAVRILSRGLKSYPHDSRLRLELGRAYLSAGSDGKAIRQFREILQAEPDNRSAKLELARALGYDRQFGRSDEIYRELLNANAADETAAIGLASNLLHEERSSEAREVVDRALTFHANSLRLQEYRERIEGGLFGGEEREAAIRRNAVEVDGDYVNDSGGNHAWRSSQRADFRIRSDLTNRVFFEEQVQHGPPVVVQPGEGVSDSQSQSLSEVVKTFDEQFRWRVRESLLLTAGGGAVQFDDGDVHAIYDTSATLQPAQHLVLGATFSRVPIIPDAQAASFKLTAQGFEAFANWTPGKWLINARGSRQHYSDENIGSRQSVEVMREWGGPQLILETGYLYRHVSFDQELGHGYFSPNDYQNHLAIAGVGFRPGKRYRGELLVRAGVESVAAGSPFGAAWEIHFRNGLLLGNWTVQLDYSKYHLVQSSGAFRADGGRVALTYHF